MKIRFLFQQGRQGPPSEGKASLLGGSLGHLLVTPPSHRAVQKTNKWVEILEVKEILLSYDNKGEKHVKEFLEIMPFLISPE